MPNFEFEFEVEFGLQIRIRPNSTVEFDLIIVRNNYFGQKMFSTIKTMNKTLAYTLQYSIDDVI